MKLKHLFYSTRKLWEHHSYFTMKGWLRAKDPILNVKRYKNTILVRYGIKLQPKCRHRRSIAIHDLKRLYKCTLIELPWAERSFEQMNFWSQHGMACKWVKKHRIYVYHY